MITTLTPTILRIGVYHGFSLMSRTIEFRTWSDDSHVSLIFPELDETIEALGRCGVVSHVGLDMYHKPGTEIDIYEVIATPSQVAEIYAFAKAQVGKKYDWGGVIGFVSRKDRDDAQKWFCSELVFAACLAGGVYLLRRIESHRVAPCDVHHSPLLIHHSLYVTGEPAESPTRAERRFGESMPAGGGVRQFASNLTRMQCGLEIGGVS